MSFGQEEVKINRNKQLKFDGESKKAEIKVGSIEDYNYLVLNINCQLTEGSVKLSIIDPKGDQQGTFTVKTDEQDVIGNNTTSNSMVSGQMAKVFGKPSIGDWIVRAEPTSAKGQLSIGIIQGFEPRIDMIDLRTLKN